MTRQLSLFPLPPRPPRKLHVMWHVTRDLGTFMPYAPAPQAWARRWRWPGEAANDCGRLTPLRRLRVGDEFVDIDTFYADLAAGKITRGG